MSESGKSTNQGENVALDAIRLTVSSTYWTQRPEGWTDAEWAEAVEAAKAGDTNAEGIEVILADHVNCIEAEIMDVFYEAADSDVAV